MHFVDEVPVHSSLSPCSRGLRTLIRFLGTHLRVVRCCCNWCTWPDPVRPAHVHVRGNKDPCTQVLFDEYKTSQGCPLCRDEDTCAAERANRRLLCPPCGHHGDRDILGSHNLLVAFMHFVATGTRPTYLCGPEVAMAKHAHKHVDV